MDTKSIITVIIGLMVSGVILMAFVPICTEVTATEHTFTNGKLYYMNEIGEDESIIYTYDGTLGIWTINGEAINISVSEATTVVAGDGFIIRANGQLRGSAIASPASIESLTVTANGVTMNYTKPDATTATATATGTVYYYATNIETDYVLCPYDLPTYVNKDSQILADGQSGIASGQAAVFKIIGSIDDGFTVTCQTPGVTIGDVVCNYEKVNGYVDLYKITNITFSTVYNDVERGQTYSSYIVPAEVTSEKSIHGDDAFNTVINLIPLIAGMGLLMAGVYYFIIRK